MKVWAGWGPARESLNRLLTALFGDMKCTIITPVSHAAPILVTITGDAQPNIRKMLG